MPSEAGTTWTIVVAAGVGSRFGGSTPKQFVEVAGKRVVDWSMLAAAGVSSGIVVVVPPGTTQTMPPQVMQADVACVTGGATRSDSVRAGLAAVPASAGVIMVHDAARPVASVELFRRVVDTVHAGAAGVVPIVDVIDTVQDLDGNVVDRTRLKAVQTPQGFAAAALRAAHAGGQEATDDASLVRAAGEAIVGIAGERWNIKVTEPEDEVVVAALLGERLRGRS